MISATIAPTSSSPSASSPLALDAAFDAVAVDGSTDFLMELQAAMTSPAALATEAKLATAPAIAAEMPATETLDELQKLPSADAPVDLSAAIFAVPPLLQPHLAEVVPTAAHSATTENSANTAIASVAAVANKTPEAVLSNPVGETDSSVLTSLGRADVQVVSPEASSTTQPATPAATPVLTSVSKQLNEAQADKVVLQSLELVASSTPTPLSEAAQTVAKLAAGLTPGAGVPLSEQRAVALADSTASAPLDASEGAGARTTQAAQAIEVVAKVDSGSMADTADLGAGSFESLSAADSPPVSESADDLAGLRLNAPPVALAMPANDAPDASALPMTGLATAQASPAFAASSVPVLDTTQRVPLEPHMMRLDSGPVQTEVIKLVNQGGGQIILELTHPDQGTYRLDLRMDAQGKALLVVEGASDSVRTRLEQGESGLRDQLSQLGLSLELNYKQQNSSTASQDAQQNSMLADGQMTQGNTDLDDRSQLAARTPLERGLVHLYA